MALILEKTILYCIFLVTYQLILVLNYLTLVKTLEILFLWPSISTLENMVHFSLFLKKKTTKVSVHLGKNIIHGLLTNPENSVYVSDFWSNSRSSASESWWIPIHLPFILKNSGSQVTVWRKTYSCVPDYWPIQIQFILSAWKKLFVFQLLEQNKAG